jgi:hypothetical protein
LISSGNAAPRPEIDSRTTFSGELMSFFIVRG